MIFEDEFTNKISEIIYLVKEDVNDSTEAIYYFLYCDEYGSFETVRFKVNGIITGKNIEAGVSDDKLGEISDIVNDEIIPELEEIFKKANKEMPVEYRLAYDIKTGAFDADYKYANDINDDYFDHEEAEKWFKTFEK